jgi:hypothetical membrane protein
MPPISSPSFTERLPALTALGSFITLASVVLVAGALTPGYSHVSQFISELGARGAPHEWLVRIGGFLPAGLLLLAFCRIAYGALPRSQATTLGLVGLALYAIGYLAAATFPCDIGCSPDRPSLSQIIHNVSGMVGYLLAPTFLFVLSNAARTWPDARHLALTGYAAAGLALLGLLTMSPSSSAVGLSQRLLEASVFSWTIQCGAYLTTRTARTAARHKKN